MGKFETGQMYCHVKFLGAEEVVTTIHSVELLPISDRGGLGWHPIHKEWH